MRRNAMMVRRVGSQPPQGAQMLRQIGQSQFVDVEEGPLALPVYEWYEPKTVYGGPATPDMVTEADLYAALEALIQADATPEVATLREAQACAESVARNPNRPLSVAELAQQAYPVYFPPPAREEMDVTDLVGPTNRTGFPTPCCLSPFQQQGVTYRSDFVPIVAPNETPEPTAQDLDSALDFFVQGGAD